MKYDYENGFGTSTAIFMKEKKSFKTINGDVSIRDWLIHNVRNKKQNNLCSAGPYAFSDTNNGNSVIIIF